MNSLVSFGTIAFAMFAVIFAEMQIGSQSRTPAKSDYAEIYLGADKLQVPAEYIGNSETQHTSALWLALFLPDLTPARQNLTEFNRLGWNRKITVLFQAGRQFVDPELVSDQMLASAKIDKPSFKVMPNRCRYYEGEMVTAHVLYICRLPTHVLKVQCWTKGDAPFPSCTVFENINSNTSVTYSYGYLHAVDAVEIDNKVFQLYDSFLRIK